MRNQPRHRAAAAALCLACALGTGAGHAAGSAASDVERLAHMSLEDLLQTEVTSLAGVSEPAFETPAAITVITSEDIRRAGHRSLPEALRMVPGMYVARANAVSWVVGSRGLTGSSITANRYLVLVDGRMVYDPLISATLWDAVSPPLADVERIEVIRGPGPTLWGVNAMNGVINVVTRDARDTLGGLAQVGAGTNGEQEAYLRHGATVSPDSAMRLWAAYSRQDAFETGTGASIHDGWSRLRVGLRWDGALRSGLGYSLQAGAYDFPTADSRASLPVPGGHAQFELRDFTDTIRGGHAMFTLGHAPSTEAGWSLKAFADRSERVTSRFAVDRDTADLEFRRWTRWGESQQLIWGASWNHTRDDTVPGPVLQFDPAGRAWSTKNLFVQNTSELVADRVFLMAGTKVTDHDFVGTQWQPSVRAWWTPSDSQTAWVAVSRPVRVPSRLEEDGKIVYGYVDSGLLAGGPASGEIVTFDLAGDDRLRAEQLVAWEAGHRIQLSPRIALDATVFYNDYQRLVGVPATLFGTFNNDATGATWGGDVVAEVRWTDHWSMEASYSRLHTRIDGPVLKFDEAAFPRQLAQLRSSLDLGDTLEFNGAAYYVDEVPFMGMPSYTRLDLGLSWRPSPSVELAVWGQNLLEDGHLEAGAAQVPRGVYAQVTLDVGD